MTFAIAYASGLVAFLLIDYIWLSQIALGFYKREIGPLMLDKPDLGIALLFYLFYVVALVILAVLPALEKQQWMLAAVYGGLLGFAAYGTYDITNLATLKGWSIVMSVVDIIWGTVLTASVAVISYFVAKTFA